MQGYDEAAAMPVIVRAMRKDGIRLENDALERFIARATQLHFAYMRSCGALDEEGWSGDGDYDEDDAFESVLEGLTENMIDDDLIDRTAQQLDSFLTAQQEYMESCGLLEE